MSKLSTPFKVGIVILIGILMTVIMVLRFASNWGQDEGTVTLHAYFDDATGLAPKSLVKVAGIQVGEVVSIELEGTRALVTFKVLKSMPIYEGVEEADNYMRNGGTITKKLSGILGDYHLQLTPGIEGRVLTDGDELKNVVQTGGAEALLNDAGKILKDVSEVTNTLSTVFGGPEGEKNIKEILENLNATTESLRQITNDNTEKISAIISYVEQITKNGADLLETGNDKLPQLVDNLSELVADLQATIDSVKAGVGDTLDTTKDGITQLRASIDKLDRTLESIRHIAQNVENGEGTVGKLLKDDSIANEAQALLTETRSLIKQGSETVESANSLIKPISDLDVDISLRGDYLINANAFRVDFGVRLIPNPSKFYQLGIVFDPHGYTTTKSVMTDSSVSGPVYETITTNEDTVKFNLQYGVRWRWFAGRFGIIDSTGGLGGDLMLFDDDLQVKFDMFAFNDNKYPRLRGTMLLYFSLFLPWEWGKTFYLSAGFDDPINTNLFDYFVGLGFRFTDNDIKSMMSIIPKP